MGNKIIVIDPLEIVSTDTRNLVRTAAEIERGKNYPRDDARWRHPNLKAADVINGWIPVYDESMWPLLKPHRQGNIPVPHRPKVIKVSRLYTAKPPGGGPHPEVVDDAYVLFCHGDTGPKGWETNGGENVGDLVKEIEAAGYKLSGLLVCNAGSFELPDNLSLRIAHVTDGLAFVGLHYYGDKLEASLGAKPETSAKMHGRVIVRRRPS